MGSRSPHSTCSESFTQSLHSVATIIVEDPVNLPLQLVVQSDRRSPYRLPTPRCAHCGRAETMVAIIRTPPMICFRCMACGNDVVVRTKAGN
jgi:hypothetical protein